MASDKKRYDSTSAATAALKRSLRFFAVVVILLGLVSVGIARLFTDDVVIRAQESARENLAILWRSYQHYYIQDGRVMRPSNDFDTVSEGQAYAMLRACWQSDRETFDAVYRWTEQNLSREKSHGDNLLSWRFGSDNMGGQTILLPPEVNVDIHGYGVMGGFDQSVEGTGTPGAPTVKVRGFSLWGGVGIRRKNRKPRS